MLRVSWTEKRTNESILMEIGQARGDLSQRQRTAKQKMLFFGHMMRANGLEKEMMLACGERRRSSEEEMDGGDTHDVRDEPGRAKECGGGSRLMEKNDHDSHYDSKNRWHKVNNQCLH